MAYRARIEDLHSASYVRRDRFGVIGKSAVAAGNDMCFSIEGSFKRVDNVGEEKVSVVADQQVNRPASKCAQFVDIGRPTRERDAFSTIDRSVSKNACRCARVERSDERFAAEVANARFELCAGFPVMFLDSAYAIFDQLADSRRIDYEGGKPERLVQDNGRQPLRVIQKKFQGYRATHALREERCAFDLESIHDSDDIVGVICDRAVSRTKTAARIAATVVRQYRMSVGKRARQMLEYRSIATCARDANQSVTAAALFGIERAAIRLHHRTHTCFIAHFC